MINQLKKNKLINENLISLNLWDFIYLNFPCQVLYLTGFDIYTSIVLVYSSPMKPFWHCLLVMNAAECFD